MGFSRQEFWSGLPCPPLGDLPNPGIKPASLMSPALAGGVFTTSATWEAQEVKMLVAQSCPTLCHPMDCSPPGSSVRGILQARILEWVAISFSRGSSQPRDQHQVTCFAGRLSHQGSLKRKAIQKLNKLCFLHYNDSEKDLALNRCLN